jgi:Ni/Co efflux regulator RcnB
MKRLIITSIAALIVAAGPMTQQLWANDAHHPEKAAKGKKSTKAKTKQKQPAAKSDKSKEGEMRSGRQARKV